MQSKVLVVLVALVAVVCGQQASAQAPGRPSHAEVVKLWLREFAKYGIAREQVEKVLGHGLAELTRADTDVLQNILNRARRGEHVAHRPTGAHSLRSADPPPLSPTAAAKLGKDLDQAFAALQLQLKKAEELVAKVPTHSPPDLKAEEATIDHFLKVVRTFRQWAAEFERQGPEMLEAATRYRAKLKDAIAILRKGADEDRADGDELLTGLASTEDLVQQAYSKRQEWAESLYHDLRGQLATVKRSEKLLTRWEAVLLLMQPIAKDGRVTQENLRRLLAYQKELDQAMTQFRRFGEKMRAASEAGATAPAKVSGASAPVPADGTPKPAPSR